MTVISPKKVILEDKTELEQIKLIQQLEDEDKQTIFRLLEKMLTNKKFKDFLLKIRQRYKTQPPPQYGGGLSLKIPRTLLLFDYRLISGTK